MLLPCPDAWCCVSENERSCLSLEDFLTLIASSRRKWSIIHCLCCRVLSWCTTWLPALWWTVLTWCWGTYEGSSRGLTRARQPITRVASLATLCCSPSGVSLSGRCMLSVWMCGCSNTVLVTSQSWALRHRVATLRLCRSMNFDVAKSKVAKIMKKS